MPIRSRHPTRLLAAMALCLAAGSARAVADPAGFTAWVADFRQQAAAQGISQATLDAALTDISPLEKVVELDRRQPVFLETFLDYLDKRVNDWRLKKGQEQIAQQAKVLGEVEVRYGVPARYLVAFWGLETNYGSYQGDTPVIAGLATLAYDARRPDFFRTQLLDVLRIMDRDKVAAGDLRGSWAGAMGHMQFIPSTWLAYAVDGDGDGRIDLRNSLPDALNSAANYLRKTGWQPDEDWGMEVKLPEGLDLGHADLDHQKPLNSWSFLGVKRADGSPLPDSYSHASLILPQGANGPAFLVMRNYRVILRWNRSINYGLAVGHLADRLAGGAPLANGLQADNNRLSRTQLEDLQKCLTALGYDPGPADGIPGARTRAAIRAYQSARGLPADGFPSASLLDRLRDTLLEQALPLPDDATVTAANAPA